MKQVMKWFCRKYDTKSRYFVLLGFRAPFDFMMSVYNANLLNVFFDAMEKGDEERIFRSFWFFLLAGALLYLYNGTIWRLFASYTAGLQMNMRTSVYDKLMKVPFQKAEKQTGGEWITRANRDTDLAYMLMGGALSLPHATIAAFNILMSGIVLLTLDWTIFLLSLLFMIPHILISLIQIARPMTKLSRESLTELETLTSAVEPAVTAAADVKLYGAEEFLYKKIEESSIRLRAARMKIHRKKAWNQLMMPLFGWSGYLAILLAGGMLVTGGMTTFGGVTKVIQYRGSMLAASMMLINSGANMREYYAGMKRMNEMMEDRTIPGGEQQPGRKAAS